LKVPPLNDKDVQDLKRQPLVAKLATVSKKGNIRITPIWSWPDGDTIVMNTFEDSRLVRNLRANPKCSLLIDSKDWPYLGVHYRGTATVEGPNDDADGIGKAFAKYMNDDVAAGTDYAKTLIGWGTRVYVRFKPDRHVTWDFRS